MRMKSALRQSRRDKPSRQYWISTTNPAEVELRSIFLGRAKKPSGKRKAFALLVATNPRWRKIEPYKIVEIPIKPSLN